MRKILYISGTRADYGPARRLLLKIHENSEFELGVLVTGMHLDSSHGETWTEIEKDGLNIVEKVYGRMIGDSLSAMSASIGLYLYGMSYAIEKYAPDIVLVLGDRESNSPLPWQQHIRTSQLPTYVEVRCPVPSMIQSATPSLNFPTIIFLVLRRQLKELFKWENILTTSRSWGCLEVTSALM